ncbi:PREDICTED: uncharacterized protein LOC104771324 isoform X1 [Camelina sativa]|uniref:Uncharacterized protein LOC104771324 isoform X1 n=1 Tax=Camelina sativa TaxID=90675 RepID=A0ABM0Y1Q1_CAMSA|nr:PREDICTED: uncharacterized protein LOC104771324 isoform X1 [Camelina sativa]
MVIKDKVMWSESIKIEPEDNAAASVERIPKQMVDSVQRGKRIHSWETEEGDKRAKYNDKIDGAGAQPVPINVIHPVSGGNPVWSDRKCESVVDLTEGTSTPASSHTLKDKEKAKYFAHLLQKVFPPSRELDLLLVDPVGTNIGLSPNDESMRAALITRRESHTVVLSPAVYDPFIEASPEKIAKLMSFLTDDLAKVPCTGNAEFYFRLLTPKQLWPTTTFGWLWDMHMVTCMHMFRIRGTQQIVLLFSILCLLVCGHSNSLKWKPLINGFLEKVVLRRTWEGCQNME